MSSMQQQQQVDADAAKDEWGAEWTTDCWMISAAAFKRPSATSNDEAMACGRDGSSESCSLAPEDVAKALDERAFQGYIYEVRSFDKKADRMSEALLI